MDSRKEMARNSRMRRPPRDDDGRMVKKNGPMIELNNKTKTKTKRRRKRKRKEDATTTVEQNVRERWENSEKSIDHVSISHHISRKPGKVNLECTVKTCTDYRNYQKTGSQENARNR